MPNASAAAFLNRPQTVSTVRDNRRMTFLPALFGSHRMIVGESMIYAVMSQLNANNRGGMWDFLELNRQPLYIRFDGESQIGIQWHGNDFQGTVSTDAAGIIA